jgi:hypothetical protein
VSRRNFDGLKTPNPSSFGVRGFIGKKVEAKNSNGVSAKCAIGAQCRTCPSCRCTMQPASPAPAAPPHSPHCVLPTSRTHRRCDKLYLCEQAYVEGSKGLRIRDEQGALWGSTNRYEESSGCVLSIPLALTPALFSYLLPATYVLHMRYCGFLLLQFLWMCCYLSCCCSCLLTVPSSVGRNCTACWNSS